MIPSLTFPRVRYGAPPPAAVSAPRIRIPWGFAEIFVISQTALPALLYLPGTQPVRQSIRVAAFIVSLAAYGWWVLHPAQRRPAAKAQGWVVAIMILLAVMIFHPGTPSPYGGLAHAMVYFAVMAPFFWAPVFVRSPEHLARLLGILLICSGVNSVVGVLQVYDPATFMPSELSRIIADSAIGLGPVTYEGPDGRLIVRPPGLFDTPGAVSGPAMVAALLGVVFGLSALPITYRIASFALSGAGIAAIYLTQVRISFVMTMLMFVAYAFVLTRQRRASKATTIFILGGVLGAAAFALAFTLGGQSITERFATLFGGDPLRVYYDARGIQLSKGLGETLFDYPLGAGLARWGMAAAYYGSRASGLWAEIQITGWLIDGGVLMLTFYSAALVILARSQYRLARLTQYPRIAACAAVVFALTMGPIAMCMTFTPFVTQIGIQFWFLAGALHGVACSAQLQDA